MRVWSRARFVRLRERPDYGRRARAVVCDLEAATAGEITGLVAGADAAVFAAGAGPSSSAT
jgi:hypothetical protein